MPQTTKTITASQYEEVRTTDAGDRYLVLHVAYDDATDERFVLPVETVVPA